MSDEFKPMPIREFRDLGFLQEANRQFFHPHGLALVVTVDETGEVRLGGIQDHRDDPHGVVLAAWDEASVIRSERVLDERQLHAKQRARLFGHDVNTVREAVNENADIEPVGWPAE